MLQRDVGLAGHVRRILGLLQEFEDGVLVVDVHHPEAFGLLERGLEAADRHVRARVDVLLQHLLVVHLVDVVAGEQDDEQGTIALDDVDVLKDRVRRAQIPHGLGDALGGGQDVEAFVAFGAEEVPAALQMTDEAVGLVLRGDRDAANA
jgi:hypothetical protein